MLSLSQGYGLEPIQEQDVSVPGGMTSFVLEKSERWLREDSDHQEAIHYIARRKKETRYRSLMDFIFCEVFIKYRAACRRFYLGRGRPRLDDLVSEEELERLDAALLKGLQAAYQIFRDKRRMNWVKFRLLVLNERREQ